MEKLGLFIPGLTPRKKSGADKKYASFNRRMLAATIDSLLLALFLAPLIDLMFIQLYGPVPFVWAEVQAQMRMQPNEEAAKAVLMQTLQETGFIARWVANAMLQTVAWCAITAWCWRRWSATPGKMLLRMKVVDAATEAPITDMQIMLRIAGYFLSGLCAFMGFFWIGIDKCRQGWHDKLAGTAVIVIPRLKAAGRSGSPAP